MIYVSDFWMFLVFGWTVLVSNTKYVVLSYGGVTVSKSARDQKVPVSIPGQGMH